MRDKICIGTMLWGTRTNQSDAHHLIDYAVSQDVRFFDTAEIYPTFPYSDNTRGISETILGDWIRLNGRHDIRISTKMRSPASPNAVRDAVEDSLRRLNVECIDYYQLHWPNRGGYSFRKNWNFDPTTQDTTEVTGLMHDMLSSLTDLVREGKIANIGMSNETAWGVTKWNHTAQQHGYKRLSFIQNEYSLLHRLFELDLAEACHHEGIRLLAWTPLAGGLLTGKYRKDVTPANSRRSYGGLGARDVDTVWPAVASYLEIANRFNADPTHLALKWLAEKPLVQAVIVGCTNVDQLRHNIRFVDTVISEEMHGAIDKMHRQFPIPF